MISRNYCNACKIDILRCMCPKIMKQILYCRVSLEQIYMLKILDEFFVILLYRALFKLQKCYYLVKCVINCRGVRKL
jgi:hypothetical protein